MALLLFIGAFVAMPALASDSGNVKLDVYAFSPDYLYPERNADSLTFCATTYADSIWADWGGGDIFGCGSDFVAIHYTGTMTFASDAPVYLMAIADDGFSLSLDGAPVIEDWWLKGCSGSVNEFTPVAGHEYVLDAWFYEYGGGACATLYSMPVDGSAPWSTVEPNAFVPAPAIEIQPSPTPEEPEPVVEPAPTPAPEPEPELPQPSPEPSVETIQPTPEPLPTPSVEAPEPTPTPQPIPEIQPTEQPEPLPPVVETPSIEPPVVVEEPILSQSEVVEQLAIAAEEDDPVLPEELAAIPLIGNAAVAVLEAFNALGNLGADMAPEVREQSEKVVVGAIIAGQIAQVAAASSVAASASTRKNK